MMGEKHIMRDDLAGAVTGAGNDFCIYASRPAASVGRFGGTNFPLAVSADETYRSQFGSWHAGGVVQFLFCDGSIHAVSPSLSVTTLGRLANRVDGAPIGNY